MLWKKVARGLSAGRVQSVAVRVVVERERESQAFIPDEYWRVVGLFARAKAEADRLGPAWSALLGEKDDKGAGPTQKAQNAWLGKEGAIKAELVEVGGAKFNIGAKGQSAEGEPPETFEDLSGRVRKVAE